MNIRFLCDRDMKTTFLPADLARWSGGTWKGVAAEPVTGFSIDTRTLQPGDLFIAIRGEKADGHAHIAGAIAKGAAAVMIDREAVSIDARAPCLLVGNTRKALGDLARGYRKAFTCPMVAVTGSVGKTTVKELLADMLHPVGTTARSRGNWNNDLGLPLSLLSAPPDIQFGVFELGMNHPGELDPLCEILMPALSIVTCIGPVHIENFPNEEGIAIEKSSVYRGLKGGGIAILNADDRYAGLMRSHAGSSRVVTVSSKPGADYTYRRIDGPPGAFEIHEMSTGESRRFTAPLPGNYFVMDVALAAAAARQLNVPWQVIEHAVTHYQPLSMRWNRQHLFGVQVINDAYNANPVSLVAAAEAFLEEPVGGRRWLVLGGMLELGDAEEKIHRGAGARIAAMNGFSLVTVGQRGAWIAEGARAAGMPSSHIHSMPDHQSAARCLDKCLEKNDAVLFKASRGEAVEIVLDEWKAIRQSRPSAAD